MNRSNYVNTLARTDARVKVIESQIEEGCRNIQAHALDASQAFYSALIMKVPNWINNAHCSTSINNIFKVKSKAHAYAKELTEVIRNHVTDETEHWVNKTLVPLMATEISNLASIVNTNTQICLSELQNLRLSLDFNQRSIIDKVMPSNVNRALSSGASLLMGDLAGAIMGGAGGFDAMLKTLTCEVAAGVVLGIIALFNPIGLTALILSVIIAAFAGGNWAMGSMEKKIREKVVEATMKNLRDSEQRERFDRMVTAKVGTHLNMIRSKLQETLHSLTNATEAYRHAVCA